MWCIYDDDDEQIPSHILLFPRVLTRIPVFLCSISFWGRIGLSSGANAMISEGEMIMWILVAHETVGLCSHCSATFR